ncbi:MAG TPA: hypothetical protein VGX03_26335, partial [Candidatus Binatia bacterium]|nr:hypothetical protein [Candidatus Binatia bacterium]
MRTAPGAPGWAHVEERSQRTGRPAALWRRRQAHADLSVMAAVREGIRLSVIPGVVDDGPPAAISRSLAFEGGVSAPVQCERRT